MFDTAMKVRKAEHDGTIQQLSVMTNAFELDVTRCFFDLFAVFGSTSIKLLSPSSVFQTNAPGSNTELVIQTNASFSGGLGARAALFQKGPWAIGMEGQYFTTNPHVTSIMDLGSGVVNYLPNGLNMRYSAGQIGMGLNVDVSLHESFSLDPYAGVFWTYSTLLMGDIMMTGLGSGANENIKLFDLKKVRQYGWALGLTAVLHKKATATVEGRFGGERAAFVTGQFQF